MKNFLFSIFQSILFGILFLCSSCKNDMHLISIGILGNSKPTYNQSYTISKSKVSELKTYLKNKKYNQNIAIFIDFKIPSNRFRFFVYDLKNDKILEKGLVAHGSGSVIPGSSALKFSNLENSYQSSLGKYEIANSYVGDFGKSYRLKGLEKSNNLAMKRAIVLHPYSCIKDVEQEELSCLSLGCPMLSQNFFNKVSKYIDQSKNPIILWTYY